MENIDMQQFYNSGWNEWYDMKEYGPASKHVRRLVFSLLRKVEFQSVMDAGCGVATLLDDISKEFKGKDLFGFEYSADAVKIAEKRLPQAKFWQVDLSKQKAPVSVDLVTCIDVLEHIDDDLAAMRNLYEMTRKYLILVVPLGPLFEAERIRVGHVHGYSQHEFDSKLEKSGFKIKERIRWGFPFYNLYRRLLHILPEKTVTGKFSITKRIMTQILYLLLFVNLPVWGDRYFLICEKADVRPS